MWLQIDGRVGRPFCIQNTCDIKNSLSQSCWPPFKFFPLLCVISEFLCFMYEVKDRPTCCSYSRPANVATGVGCGPAVRAYVCVCA